MVSLKREKRQSQNCGVVEDFMGTGGLRTRRCWSARACVPSSGSLESWGSDSLLEKEMPKDEGTARRANEASNQSTKS